jgi:hypothetical protein
MKVLQNERLLRFSNRADYWCTSVTKTATLVGVSRAQIMGRHPSAKSNRGQIQKLNERDAVY